MSCYIMSWFHLGSEGKLDNGTSVHRLQSAPKKVWLVASIGGYVVSYNFLGWGGGGGGGGGWE